MGLVDGEDRGLSGQVDTGGRLVSARLLISVRDSNEARIALESGADIIDLKEPDAGALGAVDLRSAREIVGVIAGRGTTSATVGDLPADASVLEDAVRRTVSSGVDFVKIGFIPSPGTDICGVIHALAPVAREFALIAVIFADDLPPGDPIAAAATAGFAGVMLDTADKRGGRLLDHMSVARLRDFVGSAKRSKLMTGLAGSLRREDIAQLAELSPDYLGFRGAACIQNRRGAELEAGRVASLRKTLGDSAASAAYAGDLVGYG
jgi:dihydroneopterin aldolase